MKSQEFEKILQLALFVIDDEAETKSKVDIQFRADQVTKVFKRLQDVRVQAVEKFLEDEKTLNEVKTWSNQATDRMGRVTEYRQQIEERLESVINEERETATARNSVISPDFLVWKFCEKTQFRANRPKLCDNCAQNFHTRKSDEITVFFAVSRTETNRYTNRSATKDNAERLEVLKRESNS